MEIFEDFGIAALFRYLHVIAGVAWIGLLWYFNFVQTPAFAEMEAAARNNAIDKLVSRALWWFRWAALATLVMGLLILGWGNGEGSTYFSGPLGPFETASGMSIWAGVLLGTTMAANVWMVIWPAQRIVIANARNVQAGGEPDPDAPAAARTAALASRMNTIFSIPLLMFMVFTSHVLGALGSVSGSEAAIYWVITLAIWGALEANALGMLGGKAPGGPRVIFDTHQNAIITGVALTVFWYLLIEVVAG